MKVFFGNILTNTSTNNVLKNSGNLVGQSSCPIKLTIAPNNWDEMTVNCFKDLAIWPIDLEVFFIQGFS
jgi:hypothetical protein